MCRLAGRHFGVTLLSVVVPVNMITMPQACRLVLQDWPLAGENEEPLCIR
jgi:hypothetical protein